MPVPAARIVPPLLAFAAGYVDACTFLALFGLYVAQVTGSFVTVGAGLAAHEEGFLLKVLAIPTFFAAGVFTTVFAEVLRRRGHGALAWTLALECVLLTGLLAVALIPLRHDPNAPLTLLAAMLGLSAMGVQSAAVRLLMPGAASTNVMTTNTTLFAIGAGEMLLGWYGRRRGDAQAAAQLSAAWTQLAVLIPLGLGFLFGTAAGALGYLWFGLWALVLVLVELACLVVWAAREGNLTPP